MKEKFKLSKADWKTAKRSYGLVKISEVLTDDDYEPKGPKIEHGPEDGTIDPPRDQ